MLTNESTSSAANQIVASTLPAPDTSLIVTVSPTIANSAICAEPEQSQQPSASSNLSEFVSCSSQPPTVPKTNALIAPEQDSQAIPETGININNSNRMSGIQNYNASGNGGGGPVVAMGVNAAGWPLKSGRGGPNRGDPAANMDAESQSKGGGNNLGSSTGQSGPATEAGSRTGSTRGPQGPVFGRLLISNAAAGLLIGKHGLTVNSLREKSGSMIRVSAPVTLGIEQGSIANGGSRVVSLSGTKIQVDDAMLSLLRTLRDAPGHPPAEEFGHEMRFLVPNSTVSMVIGKGGSRINDIRQSTGAKVQISSREGPGGLGGPGAMIRTILIQGDPKNLEAAALMILETIQEDPAMREFMNMQIGGLSGGMGQGGGLQGFVGRSGGSDPAVHMGTLATSPQHMYMAELGCFPPTLGQQQQHQNLGRMHQNASGMRGGGGVGTPGLSAGMLSVEPAVFENLYEIYIQIPNSCVGSVVGKNGQYLAQIRRTSGARVSISQKGELVPGTEDRLVTISGTLKCIHLAHVLIMSRLHELPDGSGAAGPRG